MGNTFKTAFLLTALTLLLIFIGRVLGGQNGMLIALIFAAIMNFVSYFFSDKIALAMYRAQPATREALPSVYQIVERLAQKIGIPTPKIYVIPTDSPNAFATGRNPQHASVAVTQGILKLLNEEELEGVLAHELGHVHNRDILIRTLGEIEVRGDEKLSSRVEALSSNKLEIDAKLAQVFENFQKLDSMRKDIGEIFTGIRATLNRIG